MFLLFYLRQAQRSDFAVQFIQGETTSAHQPALTRSTCNAADKRLFFIFQWARACIKCTMMQQQLTANELPLNNTLRAIFHNHLDSNLPNHARAPTVTLLHQCRSQGFKNNEWKENYGNTKLQMQQSISEVASTYLSISVVN